MLNLLLFDMGLPMIVPSMSLMVIALLPIIIGEAYFISRRLSIDNLKTLPPVAFANFISTLIGIPVTWLILAVLEMVTGGGARLDLGPVWEKIFAMTWQAPWI